MTSWAFRLVAPDPSRDSSTGVNRGALGGGRNYAPLSSSSPACNLSEGTTVGCVKEIEFRTARRLWQSRRFRRKIRFLQQAGRGGQGVQRQYLRHQQAWRGNCQSRWICGLCPRDEARTEREDKGHASLRPLCIWTGRIESRDNCYPRI